MPEPPSTDGEQWRRAECEQMIKANEEAAKTARTSSWRAYYLSKVSVWRELLERAS